MTSIDVLFFIFGGLGIGFLLGFVVGYALATERAAKVISNRVGTRYRDFK